MGRPQLYLHNKPIESIFELLGTDENAITYSVGWSLRSSPAFLQRFLNKSIQFRGGLDEVNVHLQEFRRKLGITDIEISKRGAFHVIIEAKKGWSFPARSQLKLYARRLESSVCRTRRIIVISEFNGAYAQNQLGSQRVRGIPIEAITWKDVLRAATTAISNGDLREKRILGELVPYLRRVTSMRAREPDEVFVVSLNRIGIENARRRRYSHPIGPRWPRIPPSYVAFRYHGRLQSIHHVDAFKRRKRDPLAKPPSKELLPHFLYVLGPAIVPIKRPRTGDIYRNAPVWCFWDTLFTYKTISKARDISDRRRKKAERDAGKESV